MAYIIPCIADGHTNHLVGLLHGDGVTLDSGNLVAPNSVQQQLWAWHTAFLADVKAMLRPRDKVIGFMDGDLVDIISKTTQLVSQNRADVLRMAVKTYTPFRELCHDGLFLIRGTEAHSGYSGELEEALARELETTKWPADADTHSIYFLRAVIDGVRLWAYHHGKVGTLEHTLLNAAGNVSATIVRQCNLSDEPYPAVALTAHVHRHTDSGKNYQVRVITLPCWQLQNAHGQKIAPNKLPTIGGVVLVIDDGHLDVIDKLYRPPADKYWSPEP